MSDVMLHGVLRMPPELWRDDELDKLQRYSVYLEASDRIKMLEQQQWIPISEMLPIDEEFDDLVGRRIEEAKSTKCRQIEKSADDLAWRLIVDLIRNKFTSGNDVPVDRIILKRSEVEAILQPPTAEEE